MRWRDEPSERGRAAFLWACGLDVAVRKPGNVSRASPGHAMRAEMFLRSAEAAVDPLFAHGVPVGERIETAVAATRAAVGCNTNLGILLLCAPLAAALERLPPAAERAAGDAEAAAAVAGALKSLRAAVGTVLCKLDVADARAAYRGIAIAKPGGLGRASAQDVAALPSVDLRAAMALAAERDSIARQYANGYADVFVDGLAASGWLREGRPLAGVVQTVYLTFLAGWPDSHIVRKLGSVVAQSVTAEASAWLARLHADPAVGEQAAFASWDENLKALAINPGTSADLTVCTLFIAALAQPELLEMTAGAEVAWNVY
jgi:triphosphoribosyl-dephospho-CoA synthase